MSHILMAEFPQARNEKDMAMNSKQTESGMGQDAIGMLGTAIEHALEEASVADVLSVLAGAFVSLGIELVRRQGHDPNKEIKIDGGRNRDITIHAPKELPASVPSMPVG